MKTLKLSALVMAVVFLIPLLLSCSKGKNADDLVKENDPWYISYRFELDPDVSATEMVSGNAVCYNKGSVYHLYVLTDISDYDDYRRAMLDTYDLEGNLVNRIKLSNPGDYPIISIDAIRAGQDANTAEAAVSLYSTDGFRNALVNIDLTSGEMSNVRRLINEPGKDLMISDDDITGYGVTDVYFAGEYVIPIILTESGSGEVEVHAYIFKGSEFINELDLSGMESIYDVDGFSCDPVNNVIYTVGHTMTEGTMMLGFDAGTGKRIKTEKYRADGGVSLAEYKTVDSGELCRIDNFGNITAFDFEDQEVRTLIDSDWYTPYFSDLSKADVQLVSCDSNTAVICSSEATDYSMFDIGYKSTVTVLMKAANNPNAGKKVIELAAPADKAISEYLSNAIYEFNRTDNEYLVRIWSKYKTGIKAGKSIPMTETDDEKLLAMIQELNGSEAPDLAIGIRKRSAMRDDVFDDLTGYLDQDVMDKQFRNIIDASKTGDKMYFLPVTLEIEGLVINRELVKDGACGITFEDFDELIVQELGGFSPYDYPFSKYCSKNGFILSCIDIWSATEGGSADFGTDQFGTAVEYAVEHFTESGYSDPAFFDWDEEQNRPRTECRYDRIRSYLDFVYACNSDKGSYTIIGTPSLDASGPRFRALETISVPASSDMKEGARLFINFLFSGAGFGGSSNEFQDIVTNKMIMERNLSIISEKNNISVDAGQTMSVFAPGLDDVFEVYGNKYSTKDMEDQLMKSLSAISTYYYDDPVITAILTEDLETCYAGDRTLDDAIKIINERTDKYINEI